MDLELGIVMSCSVDGCRVQMLDGQSTVEAVYAPPVRDTIKIRPRQLVAIDRSGERPSIVYRCMLGEVVAIDGERITVTRRDAAGELLRDAEGRPGQTELPLGDMTGLRAGDKVFFTKDPPTLHDVAVNGRPAHPERLRAAVFPRIQEYYSRSI